ncbi:unnamed protein product [Urochloa humidicola]
MNGSCDEIISQASDGSDVVVTAPRRRPGGRGAGLRVPARTERTLRAAELALRLAACGFALLAAVLLAVNRETHDFLGLFVKEARYTDMASLVVLVITNGVVASYSFLQAGRCLVSTVRDRSLVSWPMACVIFFCDQVITYAALSALAVALVAAMIGKHGQAQFGWMKTADLYKRFAMLATGAIMCAILAVMAMVPVSALSAFNLFRLCGAAPAKAQT